MLHGTTRYGYALSIHLILDLVRAINLEVGGPNALNVRDQFVIALGSCATKLRVALQGGVSPVARPCKLARPRRCWDIGLRNASRLEPAVELRLGEKRANHLQDLIGFAKFLALAFKLFDSVMLSAGGAAAQDAVDFGLTNPFVKGLRGATDL